MVRILWSGITGRTGIQATHEAKECNDIEIVAGVSRSDKNFYSYNELDKIKEKFDIIIDFSHKDNFNQVLEYAVKIKKPLIIGTAGLDEKQETELEKASQIIPIYKGGNFRFSVKKFSDKVVEYIKSNGDEQILKEKLYKTKREVPSATAKQLARKVYNETGKNLLIETTLEHENLVCEWQVANIYCKIDGVEELAKDVLTISKKMINKEPGEIYDLDKLLK